MVMLAFYLFSTASTNTIRLLFTDNCKLNIGKTLILLNYSMMIRVIANLVICTSLEDITSLRLDFVQADPQDELLQSITYVLNYKAYI